MTKLKIVASAIIRNKENKVLAIQVKDDFSDNILIPPGGRVEYFETMRECIKRECKEEINVDVVIGKPLAIMEKQYADGYWTFILFDAKIVKGRIRPTKNEVKAFKWIDIEQFANYELIRWIV
jgi:mutator protein MutT